jgi:hypothetical protein
MCKFKCLAFSVSVLVSFAGLSGCSPDKPTPSGQKTSWSVGKIVLLRQDVAGTSTERSLKTASLTDDSLHLDDVIVFPDISPTSSIEMSIKSSCIDTALPQSTIYSAESRAEAKRQYSVFELLPARVIFLATAQDSQKTIRCGIEFRAKNSLGDTHAFDYLAKKVQKSLAPAPMTTLISNLPLVKSTAPTEVRAQERHLYRFLSPANQQSSFYSLQCSSRDITVTSNQPAIDLSQFPFEEIRNPLLIQSQSCMMFALNEKRNVIGHSEPFVLLPPLEQPTVQVLKGLNIQSHLLGQYGQIEQVMITNRTSKTMHLSFKGDDKIEVVVVHPHRKKQGLYTGDRILAPARRKVEGVTSQLIGNSVHFSLGASQAAAIELSIRLSGVECPPGRGISGYYIRSAAAQALSLNMLANPESPATGANKLGDVSIFSPFGYFVPSTLQGQNIPIAPQIYDWSKGCAFRARR